MRDYCRRRSRRRSRLTSLYSMWTIRLGFLLGPKQSSRRSLFMMMISCLVDVVMATSPISTNGLFSFFEATPTIKQDILSSALLCTCQQVRDPFLSSLLKGGVLRLNVNHSNLFFFGASLINFFPKKSERGHLLSSSILPLGKNMRVSPIESLFFSAGCEDCKDDPS